MGTWPRPWQRDFCRPASWRGAQIAACAKRWEKLEKTAGELGVIPCKDAVEVLERSDILILAVKPYLIETVLAPIREKLAGKVLLSVAAGWPFQRFEEVLPAGVHHLSIMPNTPVAIGEGIVLLEEENSLSPQELSQAKELLAALGRGGDSALGPNGHRGDGGRLRPGLRRSVPGGLGGRGRLPRPAPRAFLPAGGPDAGGHRGSSIWPQASTPAP